MISRSLRFRAPLLWLVLPWMVGLALGRTITLAEPRRLLMLAAGGTLLAVIAARRLPRAWGLCLCAAMVLLGAADYALHRRRLPEWDALPPREVRLALQVERVFASGRPDRANGLAIVIRAEPPVGELAAQRVYFSLTLRAGESAPTRSAVLAVTGVLAAVPREPAVDSFEGYLADLGANFKVTRARVTAVEREPDTYHAFCARAAARFNVILGLGIEHKHPELAGLLRAMMLGETQELSEEQHGLFMRSGTMHLFAISGLNIGVIAVTLGWLLRALRLPGWARFILGAALLWLFVDITGVSPSAVRAWVMAVFFQAALLLWRPGNPLAALAASTVAVLTNAPLQVFTASFAMSYGIVAALLLMGVPLGEAWLARWSPWRDVPEVAWTRWQRATAWAWQWTTTVLGVGVATSLVSLLTGVRYFQLLTPGGFVANLALIPAAMAVTLAGFASLLAGLLGLGPLAVACNHAAALGLWLIEGAVRLGLRMPGAFIEAQFRAQWVGATALTLLMATLCAGHAWGWRRERGGFWPPVVVVALTVLFGVRVG
jgi:competence protein ComEC